jgi:adenylate kinase family enzyme
VRRVAIVSSASGNGKTTLGRALARRLDVPFVELDALVHGPNWVETPDRELARIVEPIVARDGWVIDGTYQRKLGTLVLDAADIVVWLDLPLHVWLPRLLRRTMRRLRGEEELWNGNKERFRTAFVGRNSLFFHALRMHVERRRRYPAELAPYTVVRLRSPAQVEGFLSSARGT